MDNKNYKVAHLALMMVQLLWTLQLSTNLTKSSYEHG